MLKFLEEGPLRAFLYITKVNTDETGKPIANKLIVMDNRLRRALRDQDMGSYAELLSQLVSLGYAWLPHITNKQNQETGVKLMKIFQHLKDENNCGELSLDNLRDASEESSTLCEKFIEQLTQCYKC